MSIWMQRPQKISDIYLNIGDEYGRPQDIHEGEGGPSPGVDSELIEEVPDVFDALLYDQGTDSGFVLVEEV